MQVFIRSHRAGGVAATAAEVSWMIRLDSLLS